MKNSISKLGRVLNKTEKKQVNGGKVVNCYQNPQCPPYNELACIVMGNRCMYLG